MKAFQKTVSFILSIVMFMTTVLFSTQCAFANTATVSPDGVLLFNVNGEDALEINSTCESVDINSDGLNKDDDEKNISRDISSEPENVSSEKDNLLHANSIIDHGRCGKNGDDVTWKLDSDGVLSINGNGEIIDSQILGNVDDFPKVKKVIISHGVTGIGNYAFWGFSNLISVEIPATVKDIGFSAFKDCKSLININIPSGVTSLESNIFCNCSSLTEVNIPDSVTDIGSFAFGECVSLKEISIPDGVTNIGGWAFSGCSSLEKINIPDGITAVEDLVFNGCASLKNIDIPNSVTSIDTGAFGFCSSLENIDIPGSVTSIGSGAFEGCSGLKSINIPYSVTTIDDYIFSQCSGLNSIEIPDSVTIIGKGAFRNCNNLESINIPNGVTSINEYAFDSCSSLSFIDIPDTITEIREKVFKGCSSLSSVEIPKTVKNIGEYAFDGCSNLSDIYYAGSEEEWNEISINNSYDGNEFLLDCNIHYNSVGPDDPGNGQGLKIKAFRSPATTYSTTIYNGSKTYVVNVDKGQTEAYIDVDVTDGADWELYTGSNCSDSEKLSSHTVALNADEDDHYIYIKIFSGIDIGVYCIDIQYQSRFDQFRDVKYTLDNTTVSFKWGKKLFEKNKANSGQWIKNLAYASLYMSDAVESYDHPEIGREKIKEVFQTLGLDSEMDDGYYETEYEDDYACPAYSIGSQKVKINGSPKVIIAVVIRGTNSLTEMVYKDIIGGATKFTAAGNNIYSRIVNNNLPAHYSNINKKDIIYLVTGHSLGVATA